MNYENYIELYEAVYFFNKINCCVDNKLPLLISKEKITKLGVNDSVYNAIMRILVVNNLLDCDESCFVITNELLQKHQYILDNIIGKDSDRHYSAMFDKAVNKFQFFFDSISELEYDIYSRCDFKITFEIGNMIAKHVNLANKKVLELGGNSGGLGTALLEQNKACTYTVVDTKVPCMVGNELNRFNKRSIEFIEGDIFHLTLSSESYDYIILMNLLHDFDDEKCLTILHNCTKYCGSNTKFLIIEDVLTAEFEPKEVIMHGLRLSVECRGGKQRTIEELASLFLKMEYKLTKTIKLDSIHTMLLIEP